MGHGIAVVRKFWYWVHESGNLLYSATFGNMSHRPPRCFRLRAVWNIPLSFMGMFHAHSAAPHTFCLGYSRIACI